MIWILVATLLGIVAAFLPLNVSVGLAVAFSSLAFFEAMHIRP